MSDSQTVIAGPAVCIRTVKTVEGAVIQIVSDNYINPLISGQVYSVAFLKEQHADERYPFLKESL